MKAAILALLAAVSVGCHSTARPFEIHYTFTDHPNEHRIGVKFVNDRPYDVCLSPEFWPNRAGKIDQASDEVYLIIEGRRFPIVEFNTGYCPSTCDTRVAPGEEVQSYIPYRDFGVPENLSASSKELEFSPLAYKCIR